MPDLYTVSIDGDVKFTNITELEYLELMEDLSLEFYQTGTPHPDDIKTETYLEELA